MKIKISNIKLPITNTDLDIKRALSKTLRIKPSSILSYEKIKESIDSRNKSDIKIVSTFVVDVSNEEKGLINCGKYEEYYPKENTIEALVNGTKAKSKYRPVVIGSGPAGLFAALTLAKFGLNPIVFERGKCVEERIESVRRFNEQQILDTESNIQFGEGGAGTFSDGKLNTGINSDMINVVLNEFVKHGANENIKYEAKPHIGTDILVDVVKNIRKEIIALGGEIHFSHKLVDIKHNVGKLEEVIIEHDGKQDSILTNACIIAIGHSARDTFLMLSKKVLMEPKPFSIGVRVEHNQKEISYAQYGESYKLLPPAPYKLSCHLDNDRSVYTFCMCPGGYVVAASSEENMVVTNGMSYSKRDGQNANSALLVGVTPSDFKQDDVLVGVEFQRKYERLAYSISNSYKAPCQRYGDLKKNKISTDFGSVLPSYPIGVVKADLRSCLPSYVVESIVKAMDVFDKKIKGFGCEDAIFTGVETRSSSPVRIMRDQDGFSTIKGLFPCGEGAGYAGGIMSAAVDGINTALNLVSKINTLN